MKTKILSVALCIFFANVRAEAISVLCQDSSIGNRAKIDIPSTGTTSQNCTNYCNGGVGDPMTDCHVVCELEEIRTAQLFLQAYGKSFQTPFKIHRDPKDIKYGFYGDTEIHAEIKYEISLRGAHKPEQPNVNLYVGAFDVNGNAAARPLFLNCIVNQQ